MLSQRNFGMMLSQRNSNLRIDTSKNILKFLKGCHIFGGEGPEIRVIWKN